MPDLHHREGGRRVINLEEDAVVALSKSEMVLAGKLLAPPRARVFGQDLSLRGNPSAIL
jgi:hypothetical protein